MLTLDVPLRFCFQSSLSSDCLHLALSNFITSHYQVHDIARLFKEMYVATTSIYTGVIY